MNDGKNLYVQWAMCSMCSSANLWARSLVVSDLRPETKGSWFESGCQLCAEVSSLQ